MIILDKQLKEEIEIEVEAKMKVFREKMWKEIYYVLYSEKKIENEIYKETEQIKEIFDKGTY